MKKLAILVFIFVVLAGIVIYAYFGRSSGTDAAGPARGAESVPVETMKVINGSITRKVTANGAIEASAEVEVYPRQSGELVELHIDKGDQVAAMQVLAKIDSAMFEIEVKRAKADLVSAQAAYEKSLALASVSAEADFSQAKSNLERLQALLTQAELDLKLQQMQSETDAKKASADLQVAEARLAVTLAGPREQELEQAKARVDNTKRELERLKALYEAEMISLDQLEAVQLQYDLYTAQLSLLKEGAKPEDIDVLKAQVGAAKVALESAQNSKLLVDIKHSNLGAAKAQVESAQADFNQASEAKKEATWQKELAQAEAAVQRAEASLEVAQQRLEETTIRAPISGTISQRYLDKGAMASPTRAFVTIVDVEPIKILAKVPAKDVADIALGQHATILPDAYPNQSFQGVVTNVSPVIDRTNQKCDIEIQVANADRKLMPGMFTQLELIVETHKDVPLIPVDGLTREGPETFVYIINAGKAVRKQVSTGITDSISVEILDGLKVGDEFIMAGKYSLRDGVSVTLARVGASGGSATTGN